MSRKQIRVYVDSTKWDAIKEETGIDADKDVMDHMMSLYRSVAQLKTINPDPVVAVGIAIANHQILGSTQWQRQINLSVGDHEGGGPNASTTQNPSLPMQPVEPPTVDPLATDNTDDW